MEASPIVLQGSTTNGYKNSLKTGITDILHSPFVNRTLDGVMSHPPYLFTFCTAGEGGSPRGNVVLHSSWKSSSDRKDVSIDSALFGSPR